MEFRHLRSFLAVAERGRFTAAAADLKIAQPALSQQIAALERELGVRLFDRTSRRVQLTDAGRAFRSDAEAIVRDVEAARERMHGFAGGLRGRVAVGALQLLSELRLPPLLRAFHDTYPDVEIALREDMTEALLRRLRDGELDIVLAHVTPDAPAGDLILEPLFDDELAIALAPTHRFAARASLALAELHDDPFVLFRPGSSLTHVVVEAARRAGFAPKPAFESGDSLTVRALVAQDLGVTVMPRAILEQPGPAVAIVALAPPGLLRTISLVRRRSRYESPAAAAFAAFVRAGLA